MELKCPPFLWSYSCLLKVENEKGNIFMSAEAGTCYLKDKFIIAFLLIVQSVLKRRFSPARFECIVSRFRALAQ